MARASMVHPLRPIGPPVSHLSIFTNPLTSAKTATTMSDEQPPAWKVAAVVGFYMVVALTMVFV